MSCAESLFILNRKDVSRQHASRFVQLVKFQANFHRADRSAPVRVLALQGDYHSRDSDIFPMLEEYSEVRPPRVVCTQVFAILYAEMLVFTWFLSAALHWQFALSRPCTRRSWQRPGRTAQWRGSCCAIWLYPEQSVQASQLRCPIC